MNLPTLEGYTLPEARLELAHEVARHEWLKRIQAGLEPNTLGGHFPDVRLDEALDDAWQQKENLILLVADLERGKHDPVKLVQ